MKFLRRLFLAMIILVILIVGGIGYMGYSMYSNAINETSLEEKIAKIQNSDNYIKLEDISPYFKNAIVSIEDHRFYEHSGIDIITTTRSMLENINKKDIVSGGSTITQQLGRLLYFTQEQRFTRKVAELFVAFDLEKLYSKETILELYINIIYYGDGYYGIKEASQGYFKKDPKDLTLYEASLLAGLPNAPSVYSPTKNLELSHRRQIAVLNAMQKYNAITEDEKNAVIDEISKK